MHSLTPPTTFPSSTTERPMSKIEVMAQRDDAIPRCGQCGPTARLPFDFDYAFQPIVDVQARSVYAHEAMVRARRPGGR